ncbi:uncharacterized protein JCM6883_003499 [Sporobolomyces salmoneus]|uniref:uncharacterized protein n=1 Tax=Sporobolomyces salmoneus TaxID=183962 RepID=UPI003179BC6F
MSSNNASTSTNASAPAKRARKTQSRVKGRKGALKLVMDLPIDLIWEICTHLEPCDLLALSGTDRRFRAVVTGEGSSTLWTRARKRVGLPDLQVPMSELRYATLMFGKGCNVCGKSNAGKVEPFFRARVCAACLKKEFHTSASNTRFEIDGLNRFAPFCVVQTANLARYPGSIKHMSSELDEKFPETAKTRQPRMLGGEDELLENMLRSSGLLHPDLDTQPEVESIREEMSKEECEVLNSDWRFAINTYNERPHLPPSTPFQEWFLAKQIDLRAIRKDGELLRTWLSQMDRKKSQANQDARNSRKSEIHRRLLAIGFHEDEFRAIERHSLVTTNRPLSDRTYSTKVEPELRKALEAARVQNVRHRLEQEYRQDKTFRHRNGSWWPGSVIFLQMRRIKDLLEEVAKDPPHKFKLEEEVKKEAMEELEQLVRKRREDALRAVVKAYLELKNKLEQSKENAREKKEEEDKADPSSEYTALDKLPLDLPRLPPWVPRNPDDPILADDEQLSTFLETSPLARFECDCRQVYQASELFRHHAVPNMCSSGTLVDARRETPERWMVIEGQGQGQGGGTNPPIPMVARTNSDILSLYLKLEQLSDSTPLEITHELPLPDLGDGYEIEMKNPDEKFKVTINCQCLSGPRWTGDFGVSNAYKHVMDLHRDNPGSTKLKTTVGYSIAYQRRYLEMRDLKDFELRRPFGYDSEEEWAGQDAGAEERWYLTHGYPMRHDFDPFDEDSEEDEVMGHLGRERRGCTVM